MSHQIELHDSEVEVTITIDDGPRGYDNDLVQDFDKVLRIWFAQVPITSMSFDQTATAGVFDYHFEDDTRTWDQTLDFRSEPLDPSMTFQTNLGWKLSEFETYRAVILSVIKLRNDIKVVSILAERT